MGATFLPLGSQFKIASILIYTDTPHSFQENFEVISAYADKLKASVFEALEEDAILVAVIKVYHAA